MNITFNTIFWLGIWYMLMALCIAIFYFTFRLVNMPKWRDYHGDLTSEVGYFEDPVGNVIEGPFKDDDQHEDGDAVPPHVAAG